jgi:DNA-binding MarR family transcriptional regulator
MARPRNGKATQSILRHWREAVPNDRLAHLVKDATRALLRALHMRLTEHSVPLGHWTFLRILWERDGLTQRELSEQAGVMEPTTFSALKAMERLGYIRRRQAPANRKSVFIFLTAKGRALRHKLVPLAEEVNAVAVKGAKAEDVATTRRTLLAIIENLARDEMQTEKKKRRIPSTRELGRLVAPEKTRRSPARKRGRPTPRRNRRSFAGNGFRKRS